MLKQVKIGGFIYKIDFPYVFKERSDLIAQASHAELTIRLRKCDDGGEDYHKNRLLEAILHEILHCIDYVYNNESLQEKQVEGMSQGIYQVFKDNDLSELFE